MSIIRSVLQQLDICASQISFKSNSTYFSLCSLFLDLDAYLKKKSSIKTVVAPEEPAQAVVLRCDLECL